VGWVRLWYGGVGWCGGRLTSWLTGTVFTTLILIATYKWAHQTRALDYTLPEKLASDNHSGLLEISVNSKENQVLNTIRYFCSQGIPKLNCS